MMKTTILTTALLGTLLMASPSFAKDHGKNKRFGPGHAYQMKFFKKLDLTEEQKKELKALFKKNKSKDDKKARRQQRVEFMKKQQALVQVDILDMTAVNQLADQQASRVKANFIKMTEKQHKAWKILTPEQQEKAKKMMQKRHEKRMKKKHD